MNLKRGTTPVITFQLDVSPYLFSVCHIAFSQSDKTVFIKTLKDCEIVDETTLKLRLTEADTLKLNSEIKVRIQFRVKYADGTLDASDILTADVGAILEEGELSDGDEG